MSKKKSYMSIKNLLKEDAILSLIRGFFKGRTTKKDQEKKIKTIEKNFRKKITPVVKNMNKTYDYLYGELNKSRKQAGKKPLKHDKLTVDDVVKDAKVGKY